MEIGIGLGITRFPGWGVMNIGQLFASGEQGAWYDPSDMSTLFQDSAGTVPVTAVEQPVGMMLDKARPIVTNGAERMNVLPSEAANWGGENNTVVDNKIIPNTTNSYHGEYNGIPITGLDYIIKVKAKAAGYSKFYISDAGNGTFRAAYDLANGTVISAVSNIPHDAAIVHLGAGVYELSVKVNAVTAIAVAITPYPDTGATLSPYVASFAGDGVSGVEVYAVDARLVTQADTLPRYQYTPADTWSRFIGSTHATQATTTKRPILKIDAGGCYYLSFDGVDDALQTGNIDFTGTDKMTVWAGVTKLNDAAAVILELSANWNSNSGSFVLFDNANFAYRSASRGSSAEDQGQEASLVIAGEVNTSVFTTTHDIPGDLSTIRRNGIPGVNGIADKGAGSFGNYPLYIGARDGVSNYFNGRLYSLIVRGAQTPLSQIEAAERYIKQKMRLP